MYSLCLNQLHVNDQFLFLIRSIVAIATSDNVSNKAVRHSCYAMVYIYSKKSIATISCSEASICSGEGGKPSNDNDIDFAMCT